MPKTLELHYYAIFQEQAAKPSESLVADCDTLRDLYVFLQKRYGFNLPQDSLMAAVNDEFAALDYHLCDGDQVVFIPPVSGG